MNGEKKLTMLSMEGISPIGVGLQEPPWTCRPFVMVFPTQKSMKSFLGDFKLRALSTK